MPFGYLQGGRGIPAVSKALSYAGFAIRPELMVEGKQSPDTYTVKRHA